MSEINVKKVIEKYTEEEYLDKAQLLYRETNIEAWKAVQEYRKGKSIKVPLYDKEGKNFWFIITENIREALEYIDESGQMSLLENIDAKIKSQVVHDFLIDESFSSSVIEGAFSTKKRTNEIIKNKLDPKNLSEQMILNNYHALIYILDNIDDPLSEKILLDVYEIITKNTLGDDCITEKYRTDIVYVTDIYHGEPIYIAPNHNKIQPMMDDLFKFISDVGDIHPIIKACIIHFYFVYVHPFFDGNGRTARVISFMYLIQNGYNFFKFYSVSNMIKNSRSKYYASIKQTEDYDNDLTYFIYYMVEMYANSINEVLGRFVKVMNRNLIDKYLDNSGLKLSNRQNKVIDALLKEDGSNFISISEYQKRYKTSYETARSDLLQLHDLGLLNKVKKGKKHFYSIINTEQIAKLEK